MLGDGNLRFASNFELRKSVLHVASRATSPCRQSILSRVHTFACDCGALTPNPREIHVICFISAMQGGCDS